MTQVIAFEGDGKLIEYAGGYEDWVRVKKFQAAGGTAKPAPVKLPVQAAPAAAEKPKHGKLSYKEARELEELPRHIDALEREQIDIAAHLADGTLYRSDPKRAKQLQARSEEIEVEISAALERWDGLGKKLEKKSGGQ